MTPLSRPSPWKVGSPRGRVGAHIVHTTVHTLEVYRSCWSIRTDVLCSPAFEEIHPSHTLPIQARCFFIHRAKLISQSLSKVILLDFSIKYMNNQELRMNELFNRNPTRVYRGGSAAAPGFLNING